MRSRISTRLQSTDALCAGNTTSSLPGWPIHGRLEAFLPPSAATASSVFRRPAVCVSRVEESPRGSQGKVTHLASGLRVLQATSGWGDDRASGIWALYRYGLGFEGGRPHQHDRYVLSFARIIWFRR